MKAYFWRHDDYGREGITRAYLLDFREGEDLIIDFHAGNLPVREPGMKKVPGVIARRQECISERNKGKIMAGGTHDLWGHLPGSGYIGKAGFECQNAINVLCLDHNCTEAVAKKGNLDQALWERLEWYMKMAEKGQEPADI